MLLNKILCFLFGHKSINHPEYTDIAFISEDVSENINGFRYCRKTSACPRCISYSESVKYTEEEWQARIAQSQVEYEDRLGKEAQKIMEKIPLEEGKMIQFQKFPIDFIVKLPEPELMEDSFDDNTIPLEVLKIPSLKKKDDLH